MDRVSAFALHVVLAAASLYGLYRVVRKAMAAGQLHAQRKLEQGDATNEPGADNPKLTARVSY